MVPGRIALAAHHRSRGTCRRSLPLRAPGSQRHALCRPSNTAGPELTMSRASAYTVHQGN
jgi:hypothetical protein